MTTRLEQQPPKTQERCLIAGSQWIVWERRGERIGVCARKRQWWRLVALVQDGWDCKRVKEGCGLVVETWESNSSVQYFTCFCLGFYNCLKTFYGWPTILQQIKQYKMWSVRINSKVKQKWKYDELLHMPLHEIYDLLIFLKEIRVQRNEILLTHGPQRN